MSGYNSDDIGYGEYIDAQQSTAQSLSQAVRARQSEYTRVRHIKIKIGTWNVAACAGTENDVGGWFVDGKGIDSRLAGLRIPDPEESVEAQESRRSKRESTLPLNDHGKSDHIDLYVLGMQEVVELGAKDYLSRVYSDASPAHKWRKSVADALPKGYQLVSEQQMSGLLLLIYASAELFPTITSVSSVAVGTGLVNYLGNKGAVVTRLFLGETTRLVFVNCHLASGNEYLDRRCADVAQILNRVKFDPISHAGVADDNREGIGEEDFAFWFGDLNFRIDGLHGDDIRRILMLHTKGEYDITKGDMEDEIGDALIQIRHTESDDDSTVSSKASSTFDRREEGSSETLPDPDDFQDPHTDPVSLQATLDSLLPHDQLQRVQKQGKAFHDGWREGPITFLPTYKYDVGSMGMFDSSEKKRAPSWCDRILYRTRRDRLEYEGKTQEAEQARLRDEEMKARGIAQAAEDDNVLFDYDPETDGTDGDDGDNDKFDEYDLNAETDGTLERVVTKEGHVDRIHLDWYTSHQRVLSSDHKPLTAVFTLDYDAVVPDLKAKIQQEVAKELDRAENEGRPGITIVVDRAHAVDPSSVSKNGSDQTREANNGSPSQAGVDFGNVSYYQRKSMNLTIANTSGVDASFSFVERPGDPGHETIAPKWLSIFISHPEEDDGVQVEKPVNGEVTLEPGDTITVTLEIFIDDIHHVKALNEGEADLDDVLVLRVTDGRDHFILLHGAWQQSCFGRSMAELIRVPPGGVRALKPSKKDDIAGQEPTCSVPRELLKLTEAIETLADRAVADAQMLGDVKPPKDSTGWPFERSSWLLKDPRTREPHLASLFEALDSDQAIIGSLPAELPSTEKLELVGETLVNFLSSMTDGIVTESLWAKMDQDLILRGKQQITTEEQRSWILDILSASPNHNISFVFVTSTLSKVSTELSTFRPEPETPTSPKSIISLGRTLSFKGRAPPAKETNADRKGKLSRGFAGSFTAAIFRTPATNRDWERKIREDRCRDILYSFLCREDDH